jgi:hypothetical protein
MSDAARDGAHAASAPGAADVDPEVLADWITEDVIQQLYASRQDLAEVDLVGLEGVEGVSDQLLSIIGSLRTIATVLRGHDAGATRMPDPAAALAARPGGVTAAQSTSRD